MTRKELYQFHEFVTRAMDDAVRLYVEYQQEAFDKISQDPRWSDMTEENEGDWDMLDERTD